MDILTFSGHLSERTLRRMAMRADPAITSSEIMLALAALEREDGEAAQNEWREKKGAKVMRAAAGGWDVVIPGGELVGHLRTHEAAVRRADALNAWALTAR